MASAIIHICIAKKVNDVLHLPEKEFYLGSIAPDISKQIGASRIISHFMTNQSSLPDVNLFLRKYKNDLNSPFTLGYFLHLYADYIWSDQYLDYIYHNSILKLVNGQKIEVTKEEFQRLIYGDYTTLNRELIDAYSLDLSLFYEEVEIPKTEIEEIALNKLQVLVDKMGVILLETGNSKHYVLDKKEVFDYIDETAQGFLKWYLNKTKSTSQ